ALAVRRLAGPEGPPSGRTAAGPPRLHRPAVARAGRSAASLRRAGGGHLWRAAPAEPDAGRRDRRVGLGLGRAVPPPRGPPTAYRVARAARDAGQRGASRSPELAAEGGGLRPV